METNFTAVKPEEGHVVCKHATHDDSCPAMYPYYQDGELMLICGECMKGSEYLGNLASKIYAEKEDQKFGYDLKFGDYSLCYMYSSNLYGIPNLIMPAINIDGEEMTRWSSVWKETSRLLKPGMQGDEYLFELDHHHPSGKEHLKTRVKIKRVDEEGVGPFLAWNQYGRPEIKPYRLYISDINNVLPDEEGFVPYRAYLDLTDAQIWALK